MGIWIGRKRTSSEELFTGLDNAMRELEILSSAVTEQINDVSRARAAYAALNFAERKVDALSALCHEGRDRFGVELCFVTLMTPEHQNFVGADGMSEEARIEGWIPENTVCKYVITTGTTLHIESLTSHPLVQSLPGCADMGMEAYLSTPWEFDGETVGSYCVLGATPRQWTDGDVMAIEALASEIPAIIS